MATKISNILFSILSLVCLFGCSAIDTPEVAIDENKNEYDIFVENLEISGITISKDSLLKIGLPLIVINTKNNQDPTYEEAKTPEDCWGNGIKNAKKIPGRMYIADRGELVYDSQLDSIKIKVRGNTTAYEEKKPYKIKLSKAADLLFRNNDEVYKDKNWCLIKDEKLYAKIGFRLSELMGMKWTPQFRYVNLVLNGDFKGLYMLVESIDKNNKCRLKAESGGGVLEYDAYWWNEDFYIKSPTFQYPLNYTFKYPDADELKEVDVEYFTEMIETFEASLNNGAWNDYIDVNSFVNWILCHDIMGSGDGGGTNMYILKENRSPKSKIEMPCLWDFGKAFFMKDQWSESHGSGFFAFGPLFREDSFKALYINKWVNNRVKVIEEICSFLDLYRESVEFINLETSIKLNDIRWKVDYTSLSILISNYKDWFKSRDIWISQNLNNL